MSLRLQKLPGMNLVISDLYADDVNIDTVPFSDTPETAPVSDQEGDKANTRTKPRLFLGFGQDAANLARALSVLPERRSVPTVVVSQRHSALLRAQNIFGRPDNGLVLIYDASKFNGAIIPLSAIRLLEQDIIIADNWMNALQIAGEEIGFDQQAMLRGANHLVAK